MTKEQYYKRQLTCDHVFIIVRHRPAKTKIRKKLGPSMYPFWTCAKCNKHITAS